MLRTSYDFIHYLDDERCNIGKFHEVEIVAETVKLTSELPSRCRSRNDLGSGPEYYMIHRRHHLSMEKLLRRVNFHRIDSSQRNGFTHLISQWISLDFLFRIFREGFRFTQPSQELKPNNNGGMVLAKMCV